MGNEKDLRDSKKQGEGTNAIRKGRKAKKRRGPHSKRGGEYNRPGTGAKVGRTKGRKQRITAKASDRAKGGSAHMSLVVLRHSLVSPRGVGGE